MTHPLHPLIVVGIDHRTCPLDLRETADLDAAGRARVRTAFRQLGAQSVVVVSTCNRVEAYLWDSGTSLDPTQAFREIILPAAPRGTSPIHFLRGGAAAQHLFEVVSGLQSMMVGEHQIQSQVRDQFFEARAEGDVTGSLARLMEAACATGRRVRMHTQLSRHAHGVPAAAADFISSAIAPPASRVGILGRGQMGAQTARHLRRLGFTDLVAVNRCSGKAREFAARIGGTARLHDAELRFLDDLDVLVAAARAPYPLITADALATAVHRRGGRPLHLVDISVPRAVAPTAAHHSSVQLINIDDLGRRVPPPTADALRAIQEAHALLATELDDYIRHEAARTAAPTLQALRLKLEELATQELHRTFGPTFRGYTDEQRAQIERYAHHLAQRITTFSAESLRAAAEDGPSAVADQERTVRELFGL